LAEVLESRARAVGAPDALHAAWGRRPPPPAWSPPPPGWRPRHAPPRHPHYPGHPHHAHRPPPYPPG
ncbi:MAG: PrsW family intramembrane metalloprotease, partial [Pseudonocardia sp.]|nr:PrsW family intramembrane metalloprotease [Pseudonocardia sp.]